MTESEMKSAVASFRTMEYSALKAKMTFMQSTHQSDHITPTHVRRSGDPSIPKSFYMKRGQVTEQQGWREGTVGWGGKKGMVKNLVTVNGCENATAEDEATILYRALRSMTDFMVISADDEHGGKFLYVTGVPSPYAGFSYLPGKSLPVEVHYNVLCIRANGNNKLLSTYPAPQSYIDGLGSGFVG